MNGLLYGENILVAVTFSDLRKCLPVGLQQSLFQRRGEDNLPSKLTNTIDAERLSVIRYL